MKALIGICLGGFERSCHMWCVSVLCVEMCDQFNYCSVSVCVFCVNSCRRDAYTVIAPDVEKRKMLQESKMNCFFQSL